MHLKRNPFNKQIKFNIPMPLPQPKARETEASAAVASNESIAPFQPPHSIQNNPHSPIVQQSKKARTAQASQVKPPLGSPSRSELAPTNQSPFGSPGFPQPKQQGETPPQFKNAQSSTEPDIAPYMPSLSHLLEDSTNEPLQKPTAPAPAKTQFKKRTFNNKQTRRQPTASPESDKKTTLLKSKGELVTNFKEIKITKNWENDYQEVISNNCISKFEIACTQLALLSDQEIINVIKKLNTDNLNIAKILNNRFTHLNTLPEPAPQHFARAIPSASGRHNMPYAQAAPLRPPIERSIEQLTLAELKITDSHGTKQYASSSKSGQKLTIHRRGNAQPLGITGKEQSVYPVEVSRQDPNLAPIELGEFALKPSDTESVRASNLFRKAMGTTNYFPKVIATVIDNDGNISRLSEQGLPVEQIDLSKLSPKDRETLVLKWTKTLFQITSFIHSKGYVHRDIKPGNLILNNETGDLQMIDFGTAIASKPCTTFGTPITGYQGKKQGTPLYQAPEERTCDYDPSRIRTYKVDYWSIGSTILELLTDKMPYQVYNQHTNKNLTYTDWCQRQEIRSGQALSDGKLAPRNLNEVSQSSPLRPKLLFFCDLMMHPVASERPSKEAIEQFLKDPSLS
ncbi:protein kinase [bacterium]|jgi:hypothetical protein|nr:protein kinase [bacterium]